MVKRPPRVPPMPGIPRGPQQVRVVVPPDVEYEADLYYNACSKQTEVHTEDCDGNCEKLPVSRLDIAIENERRAWARLNMAPTPQLHMGCQVTSLVQMVLEKLEISKDEFDNEYFKPFLLETMQKEREAYQAHQDTLIARSKIIMPNGPIQ